MKTAIFYGSSAGTTAEVARKIAEKLGIKKNDVFDVGHTPPSTVESYDRIILGSPTYGSGELQENWYGFLAALEVLDLEGKEIALFGTGDETMSETFCDATGIIYNRILPTGAKLVGAFETSPYSFARSKAVKTPGMAVGLLIDEVNHPDVTERRIDEWCEMLGKNN